LQKILNKGGDIIVISSNASNSWYWLRKIFRGGIYCKTDRFYSRYSIGKVMTRHELVKEKFIFWRFFPSGASGLLYRILKFIDGLLDNPSLKAHGGGITVSNKRQ
jgi:hypothetical protein